MTHANDNKGLAAQEMDLIVQERLLDHFKHDLRSFLETFNIPWWIRL